MDNVVGEQRLKQLGDRLARLGFFNLFIVAVLGLVLRSYSFNGLPLSYANLLHGHSHFAFGGWLMPMMVWMIMQYFPSIASKVSFHHWKNISTIIFLSAYGMLLSFPFQGYGVVSILFSTVAVGAGFYLAIVLFKATREHKSEVSVLFLRWSLIYLMLSAIGPFATAPLAAMGMKNSPVYFDAVYFYLHFQYNGWFVFVVAAVLYRLIESRNAHRGKTAFLLMNIACLPTYFLSTLWNHPPAVLYWVGGVGAALQLIAIAYLAKDCLLLREGDRFIRVILFMVLLALVVKGLLQFMSAHPFFAELAYQHRNLVIAYLHLVLLGIVSLFVMAMVLKTGVPSHTRNFRTSVVIFVIGFVLTELLLVASGLGFLVPHAASLLFGLSCILVLGALGMTLAIWPRYINRSISIAQQLIN